MIVVIPWRDTGEAYRRAHYWRLVDHYSRAFPVVTGDAFGPFNRSAARNAAVALARVLHPDDPTFTLVDADNLLAIDALHEAEAIALARPVLVKPFSMFGYLSAESTEDWYGGRLALPREHPEGVTWEGEPQPDFTGGAYTMTFTTWDRIGGFDEGFTGWGGEDDAFTIQTRHRRVHIATVPGYDYHLWHPSPGRWASPENYERLMTRYVNP